MSRMALIVLLTQLLSGCLIATNIRGHGTVTSEGNAHFNCSTGQTGDCEQSYSSGGSETLKATPDSGYRFSHWDNCDYETLNSCSTSWHSDQAAQNETYPITATFVPQDPPVEEAQYT